MTKSKKMQEAIKICKNNKYEWSVHGNDLVIHVPENWQDRAEKWQIPEKIFAMADRGTMFKDFKNRHDECRSGLVFEFDIKKGNK